MAGILRTLPASLTFALMCALSWSPALHAASLGPDFFVPEAEAAAPPEAPRTESAPDLDALDPLFRKYAYPRARAETVIEGTELVSVTYVTDDPIGDVNAWYLRKFPDAGRVVDSGGYFGGARRDGSTFIVTVTRRGRRTQIELHRGGR